MTILNQLRASGGTDAIINTIELQCDAWPSSVVLCDGFQNLNITTESGVALQATATGMDVALPKKDASGAQSLRFAVDNVRGDVARLVRLAVADSAEVRLIYRSYVSSDLGQPDDNPLHMIVRQCILQGGMADITAGFFDLIDTQFPRDVYNSEFAPGLKYL